MWLHFKKHLAKPWFPNQYMIFLFIVTQPADTQHSKFHSTDQKQNELAPHVMLIILTCNIIIVSITEELISFDEKFFN